MTKRILIFTATVLVAFFTAYFLNNSYLESNNIDVEFSLFNVYLFQIIATIIVYLTIEILRKKLPEQIGFLFLGLNTLQIGVFIFIFKKYILPENPISTAEKMCFFIPLFLGIIIELIPIVKILNTQEFGNKKT